MLQKGPGLLSASVYGTTAKRQGGANVCACLCVVSYTFIERLHSWYSCSLNSLVSYCSPRHICVSATVQKSVPKYESLSLVIHEEFLNLCVTWCAGGVMRVPSNIFKRINLELPVIIFVGANMVTVQKMGWETLHSWINSVSFFFVVVVVVCVSPATTPSSLSSFVLLVYTFLTLMQCLQCVLELEECKPKRGGGNGSETDCNRSFLTVHDRTFLCLEFSSFLSYNPSSLIS